ncbi:MAG: DUF484 family protein [Nitrospinae bacterium]|nr:DUF484 family protein [Nitrospinota bacterium]
MTSFDCSLALQVAESAARKAGALQMEGLNKKHKITMKGEINLVTEIDLASEKVIIETLKASFPDHSILAEEGGANDENTEFRWIIDPLDGTTNYANRFPMFAVSIGLEVKGEVLVGVVFIPPLDEMFTAIKGQGAFLNGEQIYVSNTKELINSILATGFAYNVKDLGDNNIVSFRNFLMRCRAIRRPGAAAVDLVYTACGIFEGFWELNLNPWDIAAGILIVMEAGGQVSQYSGDQIELDCGTIIASNGYIHQAMIEVLNKIGCHNNILEEDVVEYLANNPEVFINYPDIYDKLLPQKKNPEVGKNIINFHHKLVKSLQESNKKLKGELGDLLHIARENEEILSQFEAIESVMYASRSLPELLSSVCVEIEKRFQDCFAEISIFRKTLLMGEDTEFHPIMDIMDENHVVIFPDEKNHPYTFKNFRPLIFSTLEKPLEKILTSKKKTFGSIILLPIVANETYIGTLNLGHEKENHFHEGHGTDFLEMLAGRIGATILNITAREVSDNFIKDPLTGLYNKRFLDNVLVYEINRAERYQYPLSLILIDIDNMGLINLELGKEKGDNLIVSFGEYLSEKTRKGDLLIRYQGEEFALLMPNMTSEDALKRAETMRAEIEKKKFIKGKKTTISASFGVASFPAEDISSKEEIIKAADKALYLAKEAGKNKVA